MAGRPSSAQSRNAWSDDGNSSPAAMENEDFDSNIHVHPDGDQPQQVAVQEPQNGCWHKFKRGVRCKYSFEFHVLFLTTELQ